MRRLTATVLGALALAASAWAQEVITLVGAGATFPYPLMAKYGDEYTRLTGGKVRINYQSIGSGGGIRQFLEQTVHFGASDARSRRTPRARSCLSMAARARSSSMRAARSRGVNTFLMNPPCGDGAAQPRVKTVRPNVPPPSYRV